MLSKFIEDYSKAISQKIETDSENNDYEDSLEAILIILDHGFYFSTYLFYKIVIVGKIYEKERNEKEKKKESNTHESENLIKFIKKIIIDVNQTKKFPDESVISEIRKDSNDLSFDSLFGM